MFWSAMPTLLSVGLPGLPLDKYFRATVSIGIRNRQVQNVQSIVGFAIGVCDPAERLRVAHSADASAA